MALEVLRRLDTGPRGLAEAQAEVRLSRLVANVLPAQRGDSWSRALLRSLSDPFTAVLLSLGGVSAAVASWGTVSVSPRPWSCCSCASAASARRDAGRASSRGPRRPWPSSE
ncbi:hypothetical protein E4K10_32255 [Streptomyces sp. T1317-0309]|nr:hypothetical protein E4K10_32255 [Streptomyces sp. T1317-0309]